MPRYRLIQFLYLVAATLLLFGYFSFLIDDTFITLRFSENLSKGLGPNFNPGEKVEGFSNPIWMAILAAYNFIFSNLFIHANALLPTNPNFVSLPHFFSLPFFQNLPTPDLLVTSKLLSSLCYLLCGFFLIRRIRFEGHSPLFAALAYLSSFPLIIWGVSGMETSLFTLLLFSFALLVQEEDFNPISFVIIVTLIFLCRPEAPLPLFMGLAYLFWRRKISFRLLFFIVTIFAILLILRYQYYGEWLPNTYYAKHFQTLSRWPITLMGYIRTYYMGIGLVPYLGLLAYAYTRPGKAGWFLILFALWPAAFSLLVGGDWMPLWRFMIPTLPIMILLSARAFSILSLAAKKHSQKRFRLIQFVFTSALGIYFVINVSEARKVEPFTFSLAPKTKIIPEQVSQSNAPYFAPTYSNNSPQYTEILLWLEAQNPRPKSIAVEELGFFCYYFKVPCLDLHGLTDATIAHSKQFPNSVIGKTLPLLDTNFALTDLGRYILYKAPDMLIIGSDSTKPLGETILNHQYQQIHTIGLFSMYRHLP